MQRYIDFGKEIDTSCLPPKFRRKHADSLNFSKIDACISKSPLVERLASIPSHTRYVG